MPPHRKISCTFTVILILAAGLRFYGLGWGTDPRTGYFHRFHPDEATVVRNTRWVGVDLSRIEAPYGKAPMYLLRAAGKTASFLGVADLFDPDDNRSVRRLYLLGRGISALLGTLTVALVFLIGRRIAGPATGLLAAGLLAVCPGHIQQSHYYTVDISLAFWVSFSLYLMLRLPSARTNLYAACGIACGLATGTRLAGVWLGVPFFIAHLWPGEEGFPRRLHWRALLTPRVGLYIASAGLVSLACEPDLLLDPAGFFSADKVLQLMGSVRIVTGEHITVWTLYDFSTTPYLFHLTHLLYYAMGAPFQVAALSGVILALWRREKAEWVLLGWFAAYFLVVGNLHSKPIRYIVPLLPVLAVLGARTVVVAGTWLQKYSRIPVRALPALLVCLPTLAYGIAIERIYQKEDARIAAERWIQANIPEGKTVLAERGGFPTTWMVPPDRYNTRTDDAIFFVNVENCVPYAAQVEFVQEKLNGTDWIVLIAENRVQQYLTVPQRYPIGHQYYRRLTDGTLGFEQVAAFHTTPGIGPWSWSQENAEPTVTAFDHPHVLVYRRTGADVEEILSAWRENVATDERLPDPHLRKGIEAYHRQDWDTAEKEFRRAVELRPGFTLGHLVLREVYLRQNRTEDAKQAWEKAAAPHNGGIPVEARMGMAKVGLKAEAAVYLEHTLQIVRQRGREDTTRIAASAARIRLDLGLEAYEQGRLEEAAIQYRSAIRLNPENVLYRNMYLNLGAEHHAAGRLDRAKKIYRETLELVPGFEAAWLNLGILHYNQKQFSEAVEAFQRATQLSPEDWQAHLGLAHAHRALDHRGQAVASYRRVLELDPGNPNARTALKELTEAGSSK